MGTAAAILYVFLWASAFVPSRILGRAAPPLTILWIRFFLAGGALFVRYSMAQFLRFWLARLAYEQQVATDRVVEAIRPPTPE